MKAAIAVTVPLALAACVSPGPSPEPADGIAHAGLNERAYVDGPYVTPLEVIEDSRCPMNARCVWAGRTRLSVKIDLGSRSEVREIASDAPLPIADGMLSLVEVRPDRIAGTQSQPPQPYRFGFTFTGGI